MSAFYSLPVQTYRSNDPIENLMLQVTLRKRGTHGERRLDDDTTSAKKKKKSTSRKSTRDRRPSESDDEEAAKGKQGAAGFDGYVVRNTTMQQALSRWWHASPTAPAAAHWYLPCKLTATAPHQCNPTC